MKRYEDRAEEGRENRGFFSPSSALILVSFLSPPVASLISSCPPRSNGVDARRAAAEKPLRAERGEGWADFE